MGFSVGSQKFETVIKAAGAKLAEPSFLSASSTLAGPLDPTETSPSHLGSVFGHDLIS